MNQEQQAADTLYKTHFGKMVSALLQFSGDIDLGTAEDLVHDAFYTALSSWKHNGIPHNPAGWIYTVCRNNAINKLTRNKSFKNPFEPEDVSASEPAWEKTIFDDRNIQLLFACANPRLSA